MEDDADTLSLYGSARRSATKQTASDRLYCHDTGQQGSPVHVRGTAVPMGVKGVHVLRVRARTRAAGDDILAN